MDHATRQHPEMRLVTAGHAVKAMVLHGLGFVNQPLDLVPRLCPDQPMSRLLAPCVIEAKPLHDAARGRALETLYAYGVTARYRLLAATAAERWGLTPRVAHLESTRCHGAGRDHSDHCPDEPVVHITRGSSRDPRPDLNQVMLALMVEPQAGIPGRMKPLSGHRSDAPGFGPVVQAPMAQLHTTDGTTDRVADSALYSAGNRQTLSATRLQGSTRVPATWSEAPAALAQADPPTMGPRLDGSRSRVLASTDGGVAPRWVLIAAAHRLPQAQRTVDQHLCKPSEPDVKAFNTLCRTALACAADAQQALSTVAHGFQATCLAQPTVRSPPRHGQRGRPGPDTPPAQVVYAIAGGLASRGAVRQALVDQPRGFLLATHALDDAQLPPQERREGDKGQGHAARGLRFLKAPRLLAASLSLKKPARIIALVLVMTGCRLGYAALEYRIRQARNGQGRTFPHQQGTPGQNPTARWVFHDFVGIPGRLIPGPGPVGLHLTEEHQQLRKLLGKPYERFCR